MKLQINITETTKEVVIEDSCNLKELYLFMEKAFPDDYQDFKVVPKILQYYGTPIIINPYTQPYWTYPWYNYGSVNCSNTIGNNITLNGKGTFIVELTNTNNNEKD